MAAINIRRDVSDKFYRYKMPKLQCKIEGKGNGIKTVIPNMSDIAKSLGRPPTYPTKFFGCELGAQVSLDAKNDRYIVNGAHDAEKLASLLDSFITKFVLCPACKNPETDLIVKGDNITKDCKACGAQLPVDLRHKLCVYISKNPPAAAGKKNGKAHPTVKGAASLPTPDTASNGSNGEEEEGMMFNGTDAPDAVAEDDGEDDDDWAQDTSAEAVRQRLKELSAGDAIKKITGDDDDEEDGDDPLDVFAEFVTSHIGDDAEIIAKAAELKVRDDKVCVVLAQVLFNDQIVAENQVEKRASLIQKFIKSDKCQKGLLGGIERLLSMDYRASLMPKTPMILKLFYDADLIEEEMFTAWGEKASKKYVDRKTSKEIREKAAPFLTWLKEADEDEDEDDEE
ncbi:hypothetical protein HK101_003338 [Irineochytrium annulatum]|nr:hypothetical protein HK101_003338 [Irineochytrium annulatum]